jgi:hypothetical protein
MDAWICIVFCLVTFGVLASLACWLLDLIWGSKDWQ